MTSDQPAPWLQTGSSTTSKGLPLAKWFAAYLRHFEPTADEAVVGAARLVSEAVAEGHICIDLAHYAGARYWPDEKCSGLNMPDLVGWVARLRQSPLIGRPGEYKPLILNERNQLYLARYWQYEKGLADNLLQRAAEPLPAIDGGGLRRILDRLFDTPHAGRVDWQKIAAAAAVLKRFCVISGGPGTGKTATVMRVLAAFQSQQSAPLRIALAAPTGKAAMRMQETVRKAKAGLPIERAIREAIPENAGTLHRLLGSRPDSIYLRHDRHNPLPVDVLVVDEASMVDLALMAKLIDALSSRTRLILVGDKNQLASVEAGAVFADICAGRGYSAAFRQEIARATGIELSGTEAPASPLGDSILLLQHSFRFDTASGIGQLARLINQGESVKAFRLLESERFGDVVWQNRSFASTKAPFAKRIECGYAGYFAAVRKGAGAAEALCLFNHFRVLTALRAGETGAEGVNRLLEERLRENGSIGYRAQWYPGRPVVITRNDYTQCLFNGDIGITLQHGNELRVYFEDTDGHTRSFTPERLPEHETAYAMSVHKSQGSEFDEIVLLLPDQPSPVLSRSLLYTGITRARRLVEIIGPQAVLEETIKRMPRRHSGLRERLWGG